MSRFARALALASLTCAVARAAPVQVQVAHEGYLLTTSDAPLHAPTQALSFGIYDGSGAQLWTAACTVPVRADYYAVTPGAPACGPALETTILLPGATRSLEVSVVTMTLAPRLALTSAATAGLAAEATPALSTYALGGVAAANYQLRAGDGSLLTGLNANALAAGTVPNARLSGVPDTALASNGDLAKLAGALSFTAVNTFAPSSGTVPFVVGAGRTGLVGGLNADQVDGVSPPTGAVACTGGQVANSLTLASGTLGVSCQAASSGSSPTSGAQAFATGAQPACNSGNAGGLYFDATSHLFYGCDGVNPFWRATTYAASFAPSSLSGLLAWYDATDASAITYSSGALVQQWAGKGGVGAGVIQFKTSLQPTRVSAAFNGLPIVSFTPSQVLRFNPTSAVTQLSVFTVYKLPGTGTTGYPVTYGGSSKVTGQYHGIEANDANSLDIYGGFGNDSRATLTGIGAIGPGTPYQVIGWTSTSSHGSTVWSNGTAATMSTTGTNVSWNFTLGSGSASDFGGMGCQQGGCTATNLAELVVTNRVVTSGERLQHEGYLAWKSGLQASLPAGHLYKNAAP